MPRPVVIVLALAAFALMATAVAPTAEARGGRHPHFNDGGTLEWHHTLAAAGTAARCQGKVIFVEYGRLRCPSCRVIVSRVLPDPRVRSRLQKTAVGLASECDRPEHAVDQVLRKNLAHARMLPFCAFLTPDGKWISGFAGHCSVDRFLVHLRKAEQHVKTLRPCEAPTPAPRQQPQRQRPQRHTRPLPAPKPTPAREPVRRRTTAANTPVKAPSEPARAKAAPAPAPQPTPRPTPRPVVTRRPDPGSIGSPDAGDMDGPPLPDLDGCCAPPAVRTPTGPLPPPRIVIGPPVKVSRTNTPTTRAQPVARTARGTERTGNRLAATRRQAEAAAKKGAWGEVLRLTASAPDDAALASLRRRAHTWAHGRLDQAVASIAAGQFESGLEDVKVVLIEMQGQAVSIDAERGLGAIRTLLELQYLNPNGEVAKVVRRNAYDELRGTRWATLFQS